MTVIKRFVGRTVMTSAALLLSSLVSFSAIADRESEIQLQDYLSSMKGFQADFKQTVFDEKQSLLQQSSGQLMIKHPNKLRWEVQIPDEELLLSDGVTLWLYSPFLEQVSVFDLEQSISQSPFMLLTSDDPDVWREYSIEKNDKGYRITPNNVTNVAWLQVNLNADVIESIIMLDSQSKRTVFTLSNFAKTAPEDDNLFTFVVPDGVDVDDQRP
ncbi:outer membrane lipoprotein chaperone LolA [Echinimonas agarilytica]|uniref:Outer-membrane lipoprotein carrier protein n=1 Tax=Echinimonas agarilytica TaxID=1215918 RepID=A0AA41W9X5_9GAMM|nr:outer membrane lipoprotein chaperone LolA [Echinimonas agarilytica]MCM2680759.1 outer membrane lipoprotein chaperone LolA [Echinimonas agarilytica]